MSRATSARDAAITFASLMASNARPRRAVRTACSEWSDFKLTSKSFSLGATLLNDLADFANAQAFNARRDDCIFS
jgi:hypothetical protein